jgi:nucleoside-diphosphate-sugar epimerase
MIEHAAQGKLFKIWVKPEMRIPIMYIDEAATATIRLAEAPIDGIKTVNYLVDGAKPTPSAAKLADVVRSKIPGAQLEFEPDLEIQALLDDMARPLDDTKAREEWSWQPTHSVDRIVDDFLAVIRGAT